MAIPVTVICEFCGKADQDIYLMIASDDSAICDECVDLSVIIIAERRVRDREKVVKFEPELAEEI